MRSLFVLLSGILLISVNASADATPMMKKILKKCTNKYVQETEGEMKEFYLKNNDWSFDEYYDVEDVVAANGYGFTKISFKVDVYVNDETDENNDELKTLGFVFEVTPKFQKDGSCDLIDYTYEKM